MVSVSLLTYFPITLADFLVFVAATVYYVSR